MIAKPGLQPMPSRPGSSSRISARCDPRSSSSVVHCWPASGTNRRVVLADRTRLGRRLRLRILRAARRAQEVLHALRLTCRPMTEFPLTGGCLCGGVRFSVSEPPVSSSYCHCTRCQRRTGTAASASARIKPGSLTILSGGSCSARTTLRTTASRSSSARHAAGTCGARARRIPRSRASASARSIPIPGSGRRTGSSSPTRRRGSRSRTTGSPAIRSIATPELLHV